MESLDTLLREAELAHGHLCAGQVLGVRMAMLGCRLLGIDDPRGLHSPADRKRLVTFVEIDRCATDAIAVVTGCRLGKRALKFRDWGKMAATFVDLGPPGTPANPTQPNPGDRAVRIAARESSKDRARELFPHIDNKNAAQMLAYRELPDAELFTTEWVRVPLPPSEMPGYKAGRIVCSACGEGINFDRQILQPVPGLTSPSDGGPGDHAPSNTTRTRVLCQACAAPESRYYQTLP